MCIHIWAPARSEIHAVNEIQATIQARPRAAVSAGRRRTAQMVIKPNPRLTDIKNAQARRLEPGIRRPAAQTGVPQLLPAGHSGTKQSG
ncbi:MAG: hypothetical protein AUI15_27095 [Actinobacteria bacterium 13_2_20CM_2_66_6]|nr:MAG: hypothetical protein AUI15_27095 [Actinobacteria bacterium 13_2_20CM_2_66_6]